MDWVTPETLFKNRIWKLESSSTFPDYELPIWNIFTETKKKYLAQSMCLFGYDTIDKKYILGLYENILTVFGPSNYKIHIYYFTISNKLFHFELEHHNGGIEVFTCRSLAELFVYIKHPTCHIIMPSLILGELKEYLIDIKSDQKAQTILYSIHKRLKDQLEKEGTRQQHENFLSQQERQEYFLNNTGIIYPDLDIPYTYHIMTIIQKNGVKEYQIFDLIITDEYAQIKGSSEKYDSLADLANKNKILLVDSSGFIHKYNNK